MAVAPVENCRSVAMEGVYSFGGTHSDASSTNDVVGAESY
jgi:hypothetical protein